MKRRTKQELVIARIAKVLNISESDVIKLAESGKTFTLKEAAPILEFKQSLTVWEHYRKGHFPNAIHPGGKTAIRIPLYDLINFLVGSNTPRSVKKSRSQHKD